MKPFHATLRLHNNLLRQRRVELGMSCRAFAEAVGVSYGWYRAIEGMNQRHIPYSRRTGEWSDNAMKIAAFHGLTPAELWPAEILAVETSVAERTFDAGEVGLLLTEGQEIMGLLPDAVIEERERVAHVKAAVATLSPREAYLLGKRFGLGDDEAMTLNDAGRKLRRLDGGRGPLCTGWLQQIEAKGLRKLRHPSRSRALEQVHVAEGGWPDEVPWCTRCPKWFELGQVRSGCPCGEADIQSYYKVTGSAVVGDVVLFPGGPYYRRSSEGGGK